MGFAWARNSEGNGRERVSGVIVDGCLGHDPRVLSDGKGIYFVSVLHYQGGGPLTLGPLKPALLGHKLSGVRSKRLFRATMRPGS